MILVKLINDIISTTACAVVENKPLEGSSHIQKLIYEFAKQSWKENKPLRPILSELFSGCSTKEISNHFRDVVINSNLNNNGTETNSPKQVQ